MNISIRHPGFLPYNININSINWRGNPFNNKNWLHYFNSLQWLSNENDMLLVNKVLSSFYKFHCIKNNNNPYYNQLRGDHTVAIRLGVVQDLYKKFHSIENIKGVGICSRIIIEDIKNLQKESMYRKGHNHGLMVDIALLSVLINNPVFCRHVDSDLIIKRGDLTLSSMWHDSGLTREHSVSYQEYNLPLVIQYLKIIDSIDLVSSSDVNVEKIKNESKKFLGYSLKDNGEYFPLGDSFRSPNIKILKEVYGQSSSKKPAHDLLSPYSTQDGVYSSKDFLLLRRTVGNHKIHLASTCCYNSQNHKKNDELSFSLEIDGVTFFETPGWSAFASEAINAYISSEFAHSTLLIPELSYSKEKSPDDSLCGFLPYDHIEQYCTGRHSRFDEVIVERTFKINDCSIVIHDSVVSDKKLSHIISRMILGANVIVELYKEGCARLIKGNVVIYVEAMYKESGFFMMSSSKIISSNKFSVEEVSVLDYHRVSNETVSFTISWGQL